jgi:hypothetical protein
MNKKIWIAIGGVIGIVVLAVIAYQVMAMRSAGPSTSQSAIISGAGAPTRAPIIEPGRDGRPGFVLATQQPARQPDLAYNQVVEVRDEVIQTEPLEKGNSGQISTLTEIVTTNTTEIYKDETNFDQLTADGMIQRVVVPYSVEELKPGDTLFVWGSNRGDRLVADVILVYVCRTETGEECS